MKPTSCSDKLYKEATELLHYGVRGPATFMRYLDRVISYTAAYEEYCKQVYRVPSLHMADRRIIEQAYHISWTEEASRRSSKAQYMANSCAFISCATTVTSDVVHRAPTVASRRLLHHNYRSILNSWVADSLIVINDYHARVLGTAGPFPVWGNSVEWEQIIYNSCLQIVYGQDSLHSFSDLEGYLSAAFIRVMIELRLKRSMGILGALDTQTGFPVPFGMDPFLKLYRTYVASGGVEMSPEFESVNRLYKWGCTFVHSGFKSYSWLPAFALRYLSPLLRGRPMRRGGNCHSGIIAARSVVDRFRQDFEAQLNRQLRATIQGQYKLLLFREPSCMDPAEVGQYGGFA